MRAPALLLLLEAWGIGAFAWFTQGRLGSRILAALGSIGVSMLVAGLCVLRVPEPAAHAA